MNRSSLTRIALLVLIVCAAAACFVFLPIKDYLQQFREKIDELGYWGPVVLGLSWIPACLLLIPGTFITLTTGFFYGLVIGTISVSLGSVAGATAAFLVGRYVARDWVARRAARSEFLSSLDQAVADQGFKLVLLIRLSPGFPFVLLNYAFGLTKVRLRDYVLGSWIGMLPGTFMYLYVGTTAQDLAELLTGKIKYGVAQYILLGFGLVAVVLVTIVVSKVAKSALDAAVKAKTLPSQEPT